MANLGANRKGDALYGLKREVAGRDTEIKVFWAFVMIDLRWETVLRLRIMRQY